MPKSKVFLRFTLSFLLIFTSLVDATEVTLAWDPNNEPDLRGYRLHYGTRSRTYTTSVNVGNVTRHTVSLPSTGETHFFALTAYNTSLLESDFSSEVSFSPEIDLPDEGPADPTTFSFLPIEDAYLQGTTRYNDGHLKVEAGNRVSYLKFNVSGLSGTVQSAALRLQENGDVGSGTLRVHRGSHNNWTETTLSSANAPVENGQLGTFTGAVGPGQVVSLNVTPLVTGDGTYSVIVKMDAGGNDVWFGSEESARKPQLVIETSGSGTTPATYNLTVNSGSGSGSYAAGTTVNIAAAAAPTGQVFDQWTGDTGGVANVNAASTSITMPAGNATVTATYQTATSGGSGGTFSFSPVDDAYLQGTTRYNDGHLKVEAGNRVSYLKFNVSGLSGTVQSAALRLQENGDVGSGTLRVHRGSHNNWTETTLSSANAPVENGQLGTFTGAVTCGPGGEPECDAAGHGQWDLFRDREDGRGWERRLVRVRGERAQAAVDHSNEGWMGSDGWEMAAHLARLQLGVAGSHGARIGLDRRAPASQQSVSRGDGGRPSILPAQRS
jgi:hypothetical protein